MHCNNTFFRVGLARGADPTSVIESAAVDLPPELIAKIRRFDGIMLATWDSDENEARVHALGIVQAAEGSSAVIDWRRASFTLYPSPSGRTQWETRTYFKFNELVAIRYGLLGHIRDAFASGGNHRQLPPDEPQAPTDASTSHEFRAAPNDGPLQQPDAPQSNRVMPNGNIFATPERGLFMDNRTSPPRWLVCDLHFKRDLKEPRKYTKLFFLDEAVALSAGHRPCNTCRRSRYRAYFAAVNTEVKLQSADELDRLLSAARQAPRNLQPIASLPDGAFVDLGDDDYWLKWSGALHRWTPAGYVDPSALVDLRIDAGRVLTPQPSLTAMRNGYVPEVHVSVVVD